MLRRWLLIPLSLLLLAGPSLADEPAAPPASQPAAAAPASRAPAAATPLVQAWQTRARIDSTRGRINHLVLDGNVLFVQSDQSELEALDSETGRSLWSVIVGHQKFPTVPVAASAQHVAVPNGSKLYMLDRMTGGVQWVRELKGVPSAGGIMTKDRIYLPMVSGALESYVLAPKNALERAPLIFFGHGAAAAAPLASETKLMWGTDAGNVYIDALVSSANRVRFQAGGPIYGRLAYQAPRVFFTSLDGFVYAIDESHGTKLWQLSLGGPSRQPPVVVGDSLYAVVDSGGLRKLTAATGIEQWFAPGVKQFVAASNARVYAADELGNLAVFDAATGSRLAAFEAINLPIKYLNRDSDRIYMASPTGYVTCFHESALSQPVSHIPLPAKKAEPAPRRRPAAAAEGG